MTSKLIFPSFVLLTLLVACASSADSSEESTLSEASTMRGSGDTAHWVDRCNVDADCVKIPATCCENLKSTAVRASLAHAYHASLHCRQPTICPMILIKPDDSMPECNVTSHACELVAPRDIACVIDDDGLSTVPELHACPEGYVCREEAAALAELPGFGSAPGRCAQACNIDTPCHMLDEACVIGLCRHPTP
jgi:hypothetical protein